MKLLIVTCKFQYEKNPENLTELPYRIPNIQFENEGWKVLSIFDMPIITINNLLEKVGEIPTTILVWMNFNYLYNNSNFLKRNRKRHGIKFCWYFDDLHANIKNKIKILSYIDVILNSYEYALRMYYPIPDEKKTYWFPHYVNEMLLSEITFNSKPLHKILVSGNPALQFYPARNKIYSFTEKYKCIEILSHPGYKRTQYHNICGENYYKHLNKYLCCFTCCAIPQRPYIVAKFFEIISTGSLLLAFDVHVKSELKKLGFIEDVNYISCTMENMEEKINFIIDEQNKETIDKIRYNGFVLSNQHYLKERVNKFTEYISA